LPIFFGLLTLLTLFPLLTGTELSIAKPYPIVGISLNSEDKKADKDVISVNKKRFDVSEESLTGTQILQLAGYDPNQYDLFLVHGQKDELIGPGQNVPMEDGLHFNAILKNVPYGGWDDT